MTDIISKVGRRLTGQPMFSIKDRAAAMENEGLKVYHMELGDPDFDAPRLASEAAIEAIRNGATHYTSSWGLCEFREALIEHHLRPIGYDVAVDQVVILPGANSGIYWTIRVLANPGDEILIPDPGFPSFDAAARAAGAIPIPYSLKSCDGYQPDPEEICALISENTRLLILNSPSNPLGVQIKKDVLQRIYRICRERGVYILSDDTYKRMMFADQEEGVSTGSDYDPKLSNSLVLGSLSKEYSMSGFRLGYLSGPASLIQRVQLYIESVNSCIPAFCQAAGIAALVHCGNDLKRNVARLASRAETFCSILSASDRIRMIKPEGGLYVFPEVLGSSLSSVEVADLLLRKIGVASIPGIYFGVNGENHLRMSLNQENQTLEEIAGKIVKELKEL